ncbi:NADP-dependent oxidoreductase [Actinomadura fibrosa]|uniref:NADP-dependent oxidoreductase n=1 Tax=Actinomadura fibrosa TaxID=111802 RepID=A0ABW2XQD2_9ACTN|nr:NADP-dependent oxidoreductase [Actinomadura fibrosa]
MRAISQRAFGGPEVLEFVELPKPRPRRGEVLVRVEGASVNPVDTYLRSGRVQFFGPPPFTLGFDLSGVVEEAGPGVTRFGPGDAVFGMPRSPAATHAEYTLAPEADITAKPEALDHVAAAAMPAAALTAWQALVRTADVAPGQRVLVHGAAGGVGHFAVQVAKARGAHVLATARADRHEFLAGLGVDEPIDYRTQDFAEVARDIDVVVDPVGGDYGVRSLATLRGNGILVAISPDQRVTAEKARRHGARFAALGVTASSADMAALAGLAADGRLRAHVERCLPLEQAAKGHEFLEAGRMKGKVVLTP